MTDTISSNAETIVTGDIVTTTTETKTMNSDHSITTTTTVDKTDHGDEDNHMTTISETTSVSPNLDKKIIRQIEYYFSDANLFRDKFLRNEMIKDDGWIPLSILTTFQHLQSLTTDFKTIINVLKKSRSGLLQINENENKIRRNPNYPIPNSQTELELLLKSRTVFIKGFSRINNITLDKLLEFFEKYGSIDNIQMKKDSQTKDFNGSISVVFSTDEKAREFVENSKKTPIIYENDSILECSLQDKNIDLLKEKKNNKQENLTGALIHLTGITANTTHELIKEKFNPFTKIQWIDFNKDNSEAWIRLNEVNTAKDVLEKVLTAGNGKLIIGDNEVISRIVDGEEEEKFCKESNEKQFRNEQK